MTILVSMIAIRGSSPKEQINKLRRELNEKIQDFGNVAVRLEYSETTETGGPQKLIIGICSPDPQVAIKVSAVATDLLSSFITLSHG
jgi:hypothetical protein